MGSPLHVPDAIRVAAGSERDIGWLLLADCAAADSAVLTDGLATLLERLGLVGTQKPHAGRGSRAMPTQLRFADTTIELRIAHQATAIAMDVTSSDCSIIGLQAAPDPGRCTLALGIRRPSPNRFDRASAADAAGAIQALAAVAALLARTLGASSMFWSPAQLWSPTAMLADATIAMEQQGLPPVLHCIAFCASHSGDALVTRTCGLDWVCGCDLQLSCPPRFNPAEAVRRASRLAIDMMLSGPLEPVVLPGLVRDEVLVVSAIAGPPERRMLPVTLGRRR